MKNYYSESIKIKCGEKRSLKDEFGFDFCIALIQSPKKVLHSHFSSTVALSTYAYCICYRELPPLETVESPSGKSLTRSRSSRGRLQGKPKSKL